MPNLTPEQVEDAARAMPDHTLATSFLEPDARARVIALILFNHEISRARAVVSEAGLGAIRLQWWRDTVDQIYTGKVVRAQPTAIALASAIKEVQLPRNLFDSMIEGYEHELEATPFAKWMDVESYLNATFGNFNRLCLLASGLPAITTSGDEAARQAGIAWGLAHLLRATPLWASRRSLWLPTEVYNGLDLETLFSGHVDIQLHALLTSVQQRIAKARKAANDCLPSAKLGAHFPVLAPAALANRLAQKAIPKVGPAWGLAPEITLLERQIRMTLTVALGRI